jgi:hypothetical protein
VRTRRRWTASKSKTIDFGTVTIREYARTVGDNPAVGAGAPISLGWAYSKPYIVHIDNFETNIRKPGHRTRRDFYLTAEQRFHLLLDDWACPIEDIVAAKKAAAEIKYMRQISLFGEAQLLAAATRANAAMANGAENSPKPVAQSDRPPRSPRSVDRWETSPPLAKSSN